MSSQFLHEFSSERLRFIYEWNSYSLIRGMMQERTITSFALKTYIAQRRLTNNLRQKLGHT